MLTLCVRGDSMVELFKKYKVIIIFLIVVTCNIGWYLFKDSQSKALEVQLSVLKNQEKTWPKEESLTSVTSEQINEPASAKEVMPSPAPSKVPVYICGEILHPAVYYVESTAIINDVVKAGGGLTEEADSSYLNLASPIIPNQKIYIPKIGEEIDKYFISYENKDMGVFQDTGTDKSASNQDHSSQTVSINNATIEELQTLPGIGEVKAQAIMEYRLAMGGFKTVDELLDVSGIGEKTLAKIKPLITL
jgi:competence protein ComEA